ncbi:MAG: hypothetical protein IPH05_18890 [Flavobacteriales bacterium]|nr:hypothetical protein [Flavobacteriales bacterium]
MAGGANNGTIVIPLARYNMDGTLDNSFSVDGKVTTDFGTDDYMGSQSPFSRTGRSQWPDIDHGLLLISP